MKTHTDDISKLMAYIKDKDAYNAVLTKEVYAKMLNFICFREELKAKASKDHSSVSE